MQKLIEYVLTLGIAYTILQSTEIMQKYRQGRGRYKIFVFLRHYQSLQYGLKKLQDTAFFQKP